MIRHRSSVSKAGQQKSGLSTRASRKAKPSGWRSKVNCFEQLESRALLAADAFQNSANLFDVNGDGHVSPLDALAIINDLNKNGTHSLTTLASDFATPATQSVTAQASGTQASPTLFEDVNGDGVVSPLDALKVINALNSNDVAQVTLIATDMNGVPLASVPVGTVFELEALVADVSGNAANGVGTSIASGGVFEAEIDATLSSTTVAKLDPSSTVTYGPNFVTLDSSGHPLTGTNGQVSDLSQASAGKIIGTGAFGGLTPPGPGQKVLWSIPVLASATGLETFTPSAGTGLNNEIAIYDTSGNHDNALDPATQVDFEAGSVQVVPANAAIISIAPASVVRSTSTTTTEVFNVTLANPSTTQTTTVNWSTSPGTALAGVDYTSASGTLSFAPGATSGQITVQIPASAKYNPSSTFTVNLSNAVNASIGTTQAIGTITTNVAPPVFTIASPPSVVRPTSAGTTVEVFTVTLTGATEAYAAVNYSTANGVSPNGAVANVDYTPTSGQLVFQPGTTTETITVPILPNSVATGNLNFFLTLTSPTNSTIQFGGGQATGTITPPPTVDLSITKNDNKSGTSAGTVGNVTPGTALTYTITVANNGSSTATGATITDNFPAGITSESWSAIGTGGASGFATSGTTNINNTVTMPAGSTIVYTVIANVSASATGTLSNTATVTVPAGVTDTNPANNMATDVDNLVPTADLSITKIDNKGGSSINNTTGSVVPGSQITYFITVSNNGPLAATGVAVSDIFPAGLSAESWTAASTGTATATGFTPSGSGNITDPALNLPSGASVTYTVLATVANSASGTLTNIATVTGPSTPIDPVSTNNSATDSDTVVQTADLSITKVDNHNGSSITHTTGTAVPGTAVTYTIVATNNGPSAVNGVKVMDTLPAGFIISDSWSATATGGATGFTTTPSTGAINDTINMPANSTVTYTVVANISPSATGTLTNTATITAPAGVSDASGNNSATDSDTLTPTADLSITKSDNKSGSSSGSTGSVTPGNPIIYTIVVSNSGPSAATGVKVVDNMPAGISSDSWTATPSGGATGFTAASNGNINDQAVNLPSGSSITYTVMANVSGSASGTLSNTATVTAASGTTDPNGANNTAIDVDNLVPTADLSITKSDNVGGSSSLNTTGTTSPGSTITYTIVVSNAGPVEADGVTIKDLLPAGITSDTYTASATGGATGFSSGLSGAINDTAVNMPSGSKVTYIVTAVTDPAASGLISNIATVAAPAGITDPNLANNSATDKVNLVPLTDLSITKTDNVGGSSTANTIGTATNGGSITYTIVVTNSGPANATGAKIIDTLPAAFSSATYTASATGGATGFTTGVSGSISDTVNMPVDSTITYIVTANLASNFAGTVSNTAMVSAPSGDNDPNTANNSATDTDTVPGIADLVVTKSDNKGGASSGSVGTVIPGQQMTYTIMVTNNGPSDVTGATIADSLPAGISSATYSATATGGATGFKASGTGSINDTAVNMPVGSTVTYTVTANVNSAATGTLSNTATASLPAGFTDPQPSNNTATDSDNLTPTADLSITKVDNHGGSSVANTVGNVVKGQTITYTIVVTNTGPSAATGVSVVDTLPAAISGDSFTAVTTGGATGFTASGSGNISDANVTLPAGSTVTYVVTATISATTTATTMSNTATVTAGAGVADGNSANNSATDTDNIAVFTPSSLSGIEYIDSDGNGLKGTSELAVQNATIKLTGTDFLNASVNLTTNTAADGSYTFGNLNPGTYTITSVQSSMLTAGQAFGGSEAGTVLDANDIKVTIGPAGGIIGTGNNFTEKSFASAAISERILLASAHLNGTVNLNDTSLFPSTATSSVASPQVTPSVTSASLLASNAVSAPNATSAVDAAFADPDLLD